MMESFILQESDEEEDKFYWFVKSDSGCFLMSMIYNSLTSFVLKL
jgi:hypothetical protein